ncbi:hypothetical protein WA026_007596 [Henosepilachna vigintioctopunctata]|uniref:Uncharacterized protein n=1 Tax=Henosepilachna vigintioctopunctata TaxID=420089 RepID=A0AAW1UXL7_9CUCU
MSSDTKDTDVGKSSDSNVEYDERTDFYSDKFDPLFALSCKNIVIPKSNSKTYDNLSAYQRAQQKQTSSGEQAQKKTTKCSTESNAPEAAGTSGRRFLPHQCRFIVANSCSFRNMEAFDKTLNYVDDRLVYL